jgi:hypothetical protein
MSWSGSAGAQAPETWALTAHSADPADTVLANTVRDLLASDLVSRSNTKAAIVAEPCRDVACTRAAAQAGSGANVALHVSLHRLGQKLIVSATAVDVATGSTRGSERLTADRVEDLDIVAGRLATALAQGKQVEDTAELGNITANEARAPRRRSGRVALALHVIGVAPFSGYADRQLGGGLQLGGWFETYDFVIEPRFGFLTDLSQERETYLHLPLEVSIAYLFTRDDLSPLLGLGGGLGYAHEEIFVEHQIGEVLVTRTHDQISDSLMTAQLFARAGLLMLRTYDASLVVTLDYALTFGDFQERSVAQALRLGLGLVLGGS